MAGGKGKGTIVILKREEGEGGGHHGGAWKVAYADFVTAMMAFFLLMWLLNATTEDQRRGLADYFAPSNLFSHNASGNGEPFGGRTPYSQGAQASDQGAAAPVTGKAQPVLDADEDDSDTPATPRVYHRDGTSEPSRADRDRGRARPNAPPGQAEREAYGVQGNVQGGMPTGMSGHAPSSSPGKDQETGLGAGREGSEGAAGTAEQGMAAAAASQLSAQAAVQAARAAAERTAFARASDQLRQAIAADPALAAVAPQLTIDTTPAGLRVQLLDEEKQPMFTTGSATPNDRARQLLQKIAPILAALPEQVSITGHTDAAPYRNGERSNWDLSLERANATRRLLLEYGLPEARIRSVSGHADHDPLLPADPLAAANRRIAIVVLRQAPAPPAGK